MFGLFSVPENGLVFIHSWWALALLYWVKLLCLGTWSLLLAATLAACGPAPSEQPLHYGSAPASTAAPTYRFAVYPLHNPQMLIAAYQPLVDHLNAQVTDARFELEASRDYQSFEARYHARAPAFLLLNPWQTLQARQLGYHVIARAADGQDFVGLIIVRKDSGIQKTADLKGRVVCYPSPTAVAAAIVPQFYLHRHGINIKRDLRNVYVGSQESSIMNVYLRQADAGATWTLPWRLFQKNHPNEAAELKVAWKTGGLLSNSVMARNDVPQPLVHAVQATLMTLAHTAAGQGIPGGTGFIAADDASYGVAEQFIRQFEQQVRPVVPP